LTVDGNTTLGNNAAVDLVTFNARVQSNVEPSANNAYDLGSSSLRWANIYGDNGSLSGGLTVAGTLNVGGGSLLQGNTVIGGAATDEVQFVGRVVTDVLPKTNNAYDLGSSSLRWANVYGVNGDFSTVTVSGLTPGSVIFAGTGGALSQNNAKFFWDNGNERLGIGTNTPAATLHVVGTGRFDGQLTVTTGGAAITGNSTVTGTLGVSSDVSVGGNLTVDGNTTLGNNAAVDLVTFNARVQSNVEPSANNAYDLGSSSLRWANVYGVNGDFSTVTVSGLTPGSVIFAGTGGALSQNNAKFFWDNGNERLGIGTNTPAATLHVVGTGRFDGQLTVTTGGAAITGNSTVTGTLGVSSDVSVGGNLTVDGNTTLGNNAAVDLVTFNARVQSNVEPSANNAYDLGSSSLRWANIYGVNGSLSGNLTVVRGRSTWVVGRCCRGIR
jgi:cytoskeletal protein CcmA (bactofilin family)